MTNPSPPLWTSEEAAQATGGRSTTNWQATDVCSDSRTLQPRDLFVALRGPNFDGHDFVKTALENGAAAALVDRIPEGLSKDVPLLIVSDTLKGLEALAKYARQRSEAKIVAVTGSVGKTGTKEMLAACLSESGMTFATPGSFNNHWGVPLSLSRLPRAAQYAVFELGMNHAGEIGPLSHLVKPDVAIITTIEPAHLAHFSSLQEIADAKAEIFEGLSTHTGIAILNHDNSQYRHLESKAHQANVRQIWSFGVHDEAEAQLTECILNSSDSLVTANLRGQRLQYRLSIPGRHIVMNSLAVLLAVMALGADIQKAAQALGRISPPKGRGVQHQVKTAQGSFTVIDDSYNASPAAMKAAFQVLAQIKPGPTGRRIAILGDMRELGTHADALHADLAPALLSAGIQVAHCCGPHMKALYNTLPANIRGQYRADSEALAPSVASEIRTGDLVLIKGSRGSRMEVVVQALLNLSEPNSKK